MTPMRLGIIGPSLIWKYSHEPALAQLEQTFQIAAFCAHSERLKDEIAARYPGAPFVTDYEAFVTRREIDAVVVLTPLPLNAPVALAALRAHKHVFLEKPMARSLEEGEAVRQAAERAGVRLAVLEQAAYDQRWRDLRQLIRAGEIGRLVSYEWISHSRDDPQGANAGRYSGTAWRIEADFPLGTLFDGGHHQIAALCALFGKPLTLYASGVNLRPEYGRYDQVFVHFTHRNEVRGILSHASALPRGRNGLVVHGTEGWIAVERESLTIERADGTTRQVPRSRASSHEAMWRALAEAIEAGRPFDYTPDDAFRDLTILLAIERSIERDRVIELETS
jgi:scyllo-inositol 2-dehydrogenase (NADP+)